MTDWLVGWLVSYQQQAVFDHRDTYLPIYWLVHQWAQLWVLLAPRAAGTLFFLAAQFQDNYFSRRGGGTPQSCWIWLGLLLLPLSPPPPPPPPPPLLLSGFSLPQPPLSCLISGPTAAAASRQKSNLLFFGFCNDRHDHHHNNKNKNDLFQGLGSIDPRPSSPPAQDVLSDIA